MDYKFINQDFDKACDLWERQVLRMAKNQPGFIRMQFLVNPPSAMAIGTWRNKSDAEAFMQTGVFKDLMAVLSVSCDGQPVPRTWDLKYFDQA